jgi:predicted DNA-binding transcriptional regulator AlpA
MERTAPAVKLLTAKDLTAVVGSRSLAYRLLNAQGFPTITLGGRKLVREDSLNDWLKQSEGQRVDVTPVR